MYLTQKLVLLEKIVTKNQDEAAEFAFNTYIKNRFLQKWRYKKVNNAVSEALIEIEKNTAHLGSTALFPYMGQNISRAVLTEKINQFKTAFKSLMHHNGIYVKVMAGVALITSIGLMLRTPSDKNHQN